MQLAKMVVLGSLEILGTGCGYDVYNYLEKNQISKWTDIQKASIYHALRQLEKEQAIEQIDIVKIGKYPEKIIYQVSQRGRQLFDSLQEEAFLGIYPHFFGFKVALKFNRRRTLAEISGFGIQAVSLIDKQLAAMDQYLAGLPDDSSEKQSDKFFIEHDRRLFLAERQWILEAVEFVKTAGGGYIKSL